MNIFKKRPLSLILCIMLGGFSLFIDAEPIYRAVAVGIALLIFAFSFVFPHLFEGRKLIVRLCTLLFTISVLATILFNALFFPKIYYGVTTEIVGEVEEIKENNNDSSSITVITSKIGNVYSSYKILVYDYNNQFSHVNKGNIISFSATLEEIVNSEGSFNSKDYYVSNGYSIFAKNPADVVVLGNENTSLTSILTDLREATTNFLIKCTNKETGGFISALLIGEKSSLDGNTALNFRRIGISHILALSGMHLAIISFAISKFLSIFKLNKKIIVIITSIFVFIYMIFTGFMPSVVRSGLMLIISGILYLFMRTSDSYTNLVIAVFLIVLFDPTSAFDISLWLSAFATLGILFYSNTRTKQKKSQPLHKRIFLFVKESLTASCFAIGASFFIILSSFRTTSVLAPITTLIFSLIIELLMFLGMLMIITLGILPIGGIIIFISDIIKEFAEVVSSFDFATVSLEFDAVKVLIIVFTVYYFGILIIKIENIKKAINLMSVMLTSIFVLSLILTQISIRNKEYTFVANESSDLFILRYDTDVTVIYSGNCSNKSAYEINDYMLDRKVNSIDTLILSGYNSSTSCFVDTISSSIKVRKIYIPEPHGAFEGSLAEEVASTLSLYGTNLSFYQEEVPISSNYYKYHLISRNYYTPESNKRTTFTLNLSGEYYTYISKAGIQNLDTKSRLILNSSDYIILGSYGESYSSSYEFDFYFAKVKKIITGVDLPFEEAAIEYYNKKEVPTEYVETSISIKD